MKYWNDVTVILGCQIRKPILREATETHLDGVGLFYGV
jgi:hypothetical protein